MNVPSATSEPIPNPFRIHGLRDHGSSLDREFGAYPGGDPNSDSGDDAGQDAGQDRAVLPLQMDAADYAMAGEMTTVALPRGRFGAAPYLIGDELVGWLIAGASRIAAPRFLEAVRALGPNPQDGSVRAWVAAIHSNSPLRAREFALQYQIPHASHDLAALLARRDVRCVYVGNHPRHHGQTVLHALRAGKHVLCEPPIALNFDESDYLRHAAANRGLTLAVNYQHRLDPTFAVLRQMIAESDLGELLGGYIRNCTLLPPALHTWRVEPAWGGVITERSMRTVDAIRFLLGDEVRSVQAAAGPDLQGTGAIEDAHTLFVMRNNRAVFQSHDSFLLPHAPSRIDIYGTSGSVTVQPWSETGTSPISIYRHGERLQVQTPQSSLLVRTLLAFEEGMKRGNPSLAGAVDDIANLNVCSAIHESIARAISVQPTLQSGMIV